ncbi:MAG: glucokinase [Saprospiraceae bacterium]|nr:glucokinase [Saprospiraceae bacterium]
MIPIVYQEFGFKGKPIQVLAGDIGGTKTHLALYHYSEDAFDLVHEKTYSSRIHDSFTAMVQDFVGPNKPDCISVGVAGPVMGDFVKITNLSWSIDARKCARETGIEKVYLINDLVANIYGLATLRDEDFIVFHEGVPGLMGNAAMISPGTGLGEAGMFWDGHYFHPFATEGGHADYAPETAEDIALLLFLQKIHGHVSWERVVSGMGIHEIFQFLCQYRNYTPDSSIREALENGDPAAVISKGSKQGDPICHETMQMFWRNLANEAANIAMKYNGFGGVFIGGGIVPKNLDVLKKSDFLHYFLEAGRMKALLEKVPVKIVLNDRAALRGASFYGAIRYRLEHS